MSVWAGVAIVLLGVIVLASSAAGHLALIRELKAGTWQAGRISRNAVVLASLLAVVGIGMCVYLIVVR